MKSTLLETSCIIGSPGLLSCYGKLLMQWYGHFFLIYTLFPSLILKACHK